MKRLLYLWTDLVMIFLAVAVMFTVIDGNRHPAALICLLLLVGYWFARQWRVPA